MRLPFLLAPALALAGPFLALSSLPVTAQTAPRLLLSAEVNTAATDVPGGACPVLLHLRNTGRETVSMVGRLEGRLGDGGFPSYRTFSFDNVRPGAGRHAEAHLRRRLPAGGRRGASCSAACSMCHQGLSSYLNCEGDLGAERASGQAIEMVVQVTDWDPGGIGTAGSGQSPPPSR